MRILTENANSGSVFHGSPHDRVTVKMLINALTNNVIVIAKTEKRLPNFQKIFFGAGLENQGIFGLLNAEITSVSNAVPYASIGGCIRMGLKTEALSAIEDLV